MKKLITTFILLNCFHVLLYGQDSIPKEITSIGKFEINKTTISILDELQKELKTKIKVCSSSMDQLNYKNSQENFILQLVKDTIKEYNSPPQALHCEKAKVFSIKGYSIANIMLEGLELTFFNDTLIELKCDGTTEFMEAIHLKYGNGKLRQTEKEVICEVGRLGSEVKLKETAIFETWTGDDVHANSTISVYYNRKCEKNYLSYFILSSTFSKKSLSSCEDSKKLEIKKQKEEQKKKQLDGF